jgi:rubrerythrin
MRNFDDLSEREILALAISNDEEDARIYADFSDGLHEEYAATAKVFDEMASEENGHRRRLIDLFVSKLGDHIPLVRRQDIRGYVPQKPVWQMKPLGLEAARFYRQALTRTTDAPVRRLLGDLAEEEDKHDQLATGLEHEVLTDSVRRDEAENERRRSALQIIQPGLVGLMDGSVSTLAGVRRGLRDPQLVEHVSRRARRIDRGGHLDVLRRGAVGRRQAFGTRRPAAVGLVCGLMTTAGGIGHTLPYLIPYFYTATVIAIIVVVIELSVIAWIQWRFMDVPPLSAAAKVRIGGGLVLAAGILIGSS